MFPDGAITLERPKLRFSSAVDPPGQFLLTLFKTERIKMEALQEDVQSGSIREVGKKCEGE